MSTTAVIHRLAETITAHAWNGDRTKVAVCPNNNEVWIFSNCGETDTAKWEKEQELRGHDLVITAIDWCPISNRIVTCAQDRNAFVWTWEADEERWRPQLVVLRVNRAATDCKWSPDGTKFAVASAAKCVAVCAYEAEHDWWFSAQVQRFKSTVTAVAWHPNSKLVAAASCDYHCRVAIGWISDMGDEHDVAQFGSAEGFEFGDIVLDLSLDDDETPATWVNDAHWSPSGMQLAFVSQSSHLFVVNFPRDCSKEPPVRQVLRHADLPFLKVRFVNEDTLVAAGWDMNPAIFRRTGTGATPWTFAGYADKKESDEAASAAAGAKSDTAFSSARALFAAKVNTGRSAAAAASDKLITRHEGAIVGISSLVPAAGSSSARGGARGTFSTVGTDGRLILWTLA